LVAAVLLPPSLGAQSLPQARRGERAPIGAETPSAVSGMLPNTFQIITVPVPGGFDPGLGVTYEVHPLPGINVLSARKGTVTGTANDDWRVLLTVGIPANATAGRLQVANVDFRGPRGGSEAVGVYVDVASVSAVDLRLLQRARGTRPGGDFRMNFKVTNNGNAADTVVSRYQLPFAWKTSDPGDTVVFHIPRGATVEHTVDVHVPNEASGGSYAIEVSGVDLSGKGAGHDRYYVEIPTRQQAPGSKSIALNTTYSVISGAIGAGSSLMSLAFSGPIYRDVVLSVDATSAPALSESGKYKLSSLGQFPQPPNFTLSAGHWRARMGGVGASLSDVTGQGAGGRGVSFTLNNPSFTINSAFAGPQVGFHGGADASDSTSPQMLAARVGSQMLGKNWLTGTIAHLDEGQLASGRRLDVAGVGTIISELKGGTLDAELAWRRYAGGSGLGGYALYTRSQLENRLQLRALYAPGGSDAFAPANMNFNGYFTQRLNHSWVLGGSGWATQNSTSDGNQAFSLGVDAVPQHTISKSQTLSLDMGADAQRLTSARTHFNSSQEHVTGVWGIAPRLNTTVNVALTGGLVTRGAFADGAEAITSETQPQASGQVSVSQGSVRLGTLTLAGMLSHDASNTIAFPRQNQLSLRLDRFPLYVPGGYHLFATGIVQRLGWFGARPSVFTVRGDVTASLPFNLEMGLSVDRNPLSSTLGSSPWTTSFHIGRTTYLGIPSFLRYGSRKGSVFQDLNANGIRDDAEPGMSGIIVRRGDDYATTDDDGKFRFTNTPDTKTQRLVVDPRSLPDGWMNGGAPLSEAAARKVKDIAVVPTAAVRIRIALQRKDAGVEKIDLAAVVVTASDATGRTYVAQPSPEAGVQEFSELPPGDYRVSVNPSAAGSLQVIAAPATFTVGARSSAQEYSVLLQTQTIKIKSFGKATIPDPGAAAKAPEKP
jgi:hypothetical protein